MMFILKLMSWPKALELPCPCMLLDISAVLFKFKLLPRSRVLLVLLAMLVYIRLLSRALVCLLIEFSAASVFLCEFSADVTLLLPRFGTPVLTNEDVFELYMS
jgi:hypothetical protein